MHLSLFLNTTTPESQGKIFLNNKGETLNGQGNWNFRVSNIILFF